MKVTLKLTLDGLMRALRAHAHRKAEEVEAARSAANSRVIPLRPVRQRRKTTERDDDGRGD